MVTNVNGAARPSLKEFLRTNTTVVQPANQRVLLSNCANDEARPLPEITADVIRILGGWPKCVAGELLAPDGSNGLRELRNVSSLVAYLSASADVDWRRGSIFPTKDELFERLQQQSEQYEVVEYYPHHRPLGGTLYYHPPIPRACTGALDRLLDYFSPASEIDRTLLRAYLCTLLWGGTPGARPIFIFGHGGSPGDAVDMRDTGRGISKSTTVALASSLVGGIIDCGSDTDIGLLETRLLSPGARSKRVVRIDNVKSERLSSAGLERITTSPVISGRKLYAGEGCRPNYLTFAITMNGVSVSEDLASRSVLINLRRPTEYRSTWQREVQQFIEQYRWEIIAEILSILNQPSSSELQGFRRHAEWEAEVLGRQPDAQRAMNTLQERRGQIDGDAETVQAILDQIRQRSREERRCPFRLCSSMMSECVLNATGERYAANKLKTVLARLSIPGLIHRRDNRGAYYEWTERAGSR